MRSRCQVEFWKGVELVLRTIWKAVGELLHTKTRRKINQQTGCISKFEAKPISKYNTSNTAQQKHHSKSITANTAEQKQQSKCKLVSASQQITYGNLFSVKI